MGKIRVLSEHLSNKIAAGEVVERPASVVKELVENAIDAKSSRIFVSILEGGTELIQVVDNGEGMSQDEALLAFRRHATSKISNEEDLAAIRTLGFRGEALPSIASIAQIRLRTLTANAREGCEIKILGGEILEVKSVGTPCGSSFEIRNLFYNVPARKKFLKTRQTELSHISRLLSDLALSHETIHFRLTHGGRTLLDVPACPSLKERVFQLFGDKVLSQSLETANETPTLNGLSLRAFLSRPPLKKNFRKEQRIFVNKRPVKSALLSHAIYDAYGTALMKGEAPFFVLFLTVNPSEVDVNVHPTKSEVRFRDTRAVHQAVRNIIREAISLEQDRFLEKEPFHRSPLRTPKEFASGEKEGAKQKDFSHEDSHEWPGWPNLQKNESTRTKVSETTGSYIAETGSFFKTAGAEQRPDLGTELPVIRPLGQVYGTFLLAEIDGVLVMVDQHTAHERILYEELLEAWEKSVKVTEDATETQEDGLEIQPFLIPQQIDLPLAKGTVLKDHLPTLKNIGCKIEPFGETNFIVREMPALLVGMHLESFLHELCDDLAEFGLSAKADLPFRTIIASMACHAAVRANQKMSLPEIDALLKNYFQRNTPLTCPHGRPIVQTYPMSDLEKLFRRK